METPVVRKAAEGGATERPLTITPPPCPLPEGIDMELDIWWKGFQSFACTDDQPLVQREEEYARVISVCVEVQAELRLPSAVSNFPKVVPPAVINTFGAGKSELGRRVMMAEGLRCPQVQARCRDRLSGSKMSAPLLLEALISRPPVVETVTFVETRTLAAQLQLWCSSSDHEDVYAMLSKIADTCSARGGGSPHVYLHFDECGALSGGDLEVLREAVTELAFVWARAERQLLFLLTGKVLVASSKEKDTVTSSTAFRYLPLSALTEASIRQLQDRFLASNVELREVGESIMLVMLEYPVSPSRPSLLFSTTSLSLPPFLSFASPVPVPRPLPSFLPLPTTLSLPLSPLLALSYRSPPPSPGPS
jgi:hypothetical protein